MNISDSDVKKKESECELLNHEKDRYNGMDGCCASLHIWYMVMFVNCKLIEY